MEDETRMSEIVAVHAQYGWSVLYDDLPRDGTIFAPRTSSTPEPGFQHALAKLANSTLLPGLASGQLNGVFIGDEICCGHPECWPQLHAANITITCADYAVFFYCNKPNAASSLPSLARARCSSRMRSARMHASHARTQPHEEGRQMPFVFPACKLI